MAEPTRDVILQSLARVIDPLTGRDVVSAGLISGVTVQGGRAGFLITIDPTEQEARGMLQPACEQEVSKIPGITHVTAVLTGKAQPGAPLPQGGAGPDRARAQWNLTPVENVRRIIAVSSGKGGVGKSTVATGLALALAAQGQSVGLLDLDLYGPSLPRMMGISQKPEMRDGRLIPPVARGVQCLSMGLLMEGAAVVRGPIISRTLQQMLRGSAWGMDGKPLDTLVIDLPPGTGDIQLSLAQAAPLSYNGGGALLVTTPQMVAVEDAHKAAQMWGKVNVPILGVIENMSWFEYPAGQRHLLFGEGGGTALADTFGLPLLAQLPLQPALREQADSGQIDPAFFTALAARIS